MTMTESQLPSLHRPAHLKRLSSLSSPPPSPSHPRSPTPSEHVFHLNQSGPASSASPPWLSLRVRSHAGPGKTHPLYFDRDVVEGAVHLNLDSPQHILGVSVVVRAQYLAVGVDLPPFLEITQPLWSSATGQPKHGNLILKSSSGKLSGHYAWPFAIQLPNEVTIQKGNGPMVFPLPPSCSPKGLSSYIDYKLQVIVRRSTLRVDNTLTTSFVYLPRSRAPQPSRLLLAAYEHGRPILGPHLDPEGWRITPTRRLAGTLHNSRATYLDCTLSIAQPVSYARDCPIPLQIIVKSPDPHLLDLLASPSTISVQLVQEVHMYHYVPDSLRPHTTHKVSSPPETPHQEVTALGSCWFPTESQQSQFTRQLEGEVIIPKNLKPSFSFSSISLQYTIQLDFHADGFSTNQKSPLFSEPVKVVTDRAKGYTPQSRSPHRLS